MLLGTQTSSEVSYYRMKGAAMIPDSRLTLVVLSVLLVAATGCESLLVYEEDSGGVRASKVATRTLLGLGTIGLSEIQMASIKERLEDTAYPVTAGFRHRELTRAPGRAMIIGARPSAVAATQRVLAGLGVTVLERQEIDHVQAEQRFRLQHASDRDADLLHVGQLLGADQVVFVEATERRTRFGLSIIPHYSLSVAVRGVETETGRVLWSGTATTSAPLPDPDEGFSSLIQWAMARALCPIENGARWRDPGPYHRESGCRRHLS